MCFNSDIDQQFLYFILDYNMPIKLHFIKIIPEDLANKRLDQALNILLPEYSRAKIQNWIKEKQVTINGKLAPQKEKVKTSDQIEINAEVTTEENSQPQKIALDIVYEDQDIIVINKRVGLVVHPGAGQKDNTLMNALLYHAPELKNIPRAGIIHRLDKDTSGLLVITRTLEAHSKLVKELQARNIKREYEAIIYGELTSGGTIEAAISRHKTKRTLMAVNETGKSAITHYRIIKRFPAFTHIQINLETGRTHQIRVHMAHIGHPIVGDPTYGGRLKIPKGSSEELKNYLQNFKRQALHARKLGLKHPRTNKNMEFTAPLPHDMMQLLELLKKQNI